MKKIKQRDITDCGAACIASVAAYYKLRIPVARIRQFASTDKKGTNVLGMIEASTKLGFQSKGVKGSFDSLSRIPKPAIAHVIIRSLNHYVVIYKATKTHVTIMDPADGKIHRIQNEVFKDQWTGVLILILPSAEFIPDNQKISNISRLWFLIKPHKAVMLQAIFGAIIYTLIGLSVSIYVQQIVDNVLPDRNKNLLNMLSAVMLVLLTMQFVIGYLKSEFALKTGQHIDAGLILGYYRHLFKLPQVFFDTMRVGEILSRVNDAVKIRLFINEIVLNIIVNILIILFSFCLMFTYFWKLAILALTIIPLYIAIYIISNILNRKMLRKLMENSADLETQLVESLNGISTIKKFGIEDFTHLKTETKFVDLLKTVYKVSIQSIGLGSFSDYLSKIIVIVILWSGTNFVLDDQLTPGELLSFYALIGYLTGPISNLITSNKSTQDALIAADRLFEILDLEQEENHKQETFINTIGDIVFENVAFRYGSRKQVFENLSFTITRGNVSGIVGESGSGKSTISALIQNLYKLEGGSIKIGGTDIKYYDNDALRQLISVVPQNIDLFAGSIKENIALGKFEPDMQKILWISRNLGIDHFISALPQGYNTLLGEHGLNISGGQRQRIAIARALYRDPEILILDEATSSLDPIAEQHVQSTIDLLKKMNKTVIIIAHRLSTIINADEILVFKDGNLAEKGTHNELIDKESIYNKLWNYHQGILI